MVQPRQIVRLLALLITTAAWVSAQESDPNIPSELNIGFGVAAYNSVYKGDDSETLAIPIIFYESEKFYFRGRMGGYRFFGDETFSVAAIGQWRVDGYDDDDSWFLRGMKDREMTLDGGLSATYFDGWGATTVSLVTDLLGRHDGQELTVSYGHRFLSERWTLIPAAGVLWKSNNLADYYYGVRAGEAISGRPAYSAGDGWDPFVSLYTTYKITDQWSFLATLRYEWLGSEITDSPIVNDHYQAMLMAGLMYQF
ncbi:MAG: MipA/OmpV family protein [Planctomycetales bacterium]|nr:MipA/OmpV family protein [Planctomycetales bacterium]